MCSCHSILECCVTFSGVKLSIRSFVLLLLLLLLLRECLNLGLLILMRSSAKRDVKLIAFANFLFDFFLKIQPHMSAKTN